MGRRIAPALLAAALGLLLASGSAVAATPGVTAKTIVLGSSGPLTGDAASAAGVLRGANAYLKYVNSLGGVAGRKLELTILDDAGDSQKALQNARQLVLQDQVFAVYSLVGTDSNLAVRDFLNAAGVPQVFAASGDSALGLGYVRYPWTIGYQPTYAGEGRAYAANVLASGAKSPKVAILYEADAFGRDLLRGFRAGLGTRARKTIVETIGYLPTDTDIQAQVAQLKGSGATTFCIFASVKFAIQAFVYADKLGWHPRIYVDDAAAPASVMRLTPQTTAVNAVSLAWAKDPVISGATPDPGLQLAKKIVKRFLPGGSVSDSTVIAGMASAYSLVDALRSVGRDLTRSALMRAVTNLDETNNPFLLGGGDVNTTPTFRFPVAQVQLERWQGTQWTPFGRLVPAFP